MQKCPLCDRKIRADDRFCSACGWDLTDHELTALQIARVQEEIQHVRDGATGLSTGGIAFMMLALASHTILGWFALAEVIPRRLGFLSITGYWLFFLFVGIALFFFAYRYGKKRDRLRTLLRDRPSFQK